ncbi:hypothetical protein ACFVU2_21055 [Leifsonia sp. NPDC058194]|uniref:hypothetical protein n=1 Tax=Leifsonia sp. NPDC058194 TaxID=3346374 RepID=UPI0036D841C4
MDDATAILALIKGVSKVRVLQGQYRGLSNGRLLVDVGGGRIPAQVWTSYRPALNSDVTVVFVNDTPYMVGPASPLPPEGTVVSVASSLVTLNTDQGQVIATYPNGATLTAGQQCKLLWSGELPHVVSVMSTTPAPPPVPGAPGGGGGVNVQEFTATDSGSFGSRWFTNQVWSSDSNLGAFFFGSKISGTIWPLATIQKTEVYISPVQIRGSAPNIATHPHPSKPGGAPSMTNRQTVGIAAGWVTVDNSIGQALKSGGGSYGWGFNHGGGPTIMRDLTEDPRSGAIRITWI